MVTHIHIYRLFCRKRLIRIYAGEQRRKLTSSFVKNCVGLLFPLLAFISSSTCEECEQTPAESHLPHETPILVIATAYLQQKLIGLLGASVHKPCTELLKESVDTVLGNVLISISPRVPRAAHVQRAVEPTGFIREEKNHTHIKIWSNLPKKSSYIGS